MIFSNPEYPLSNRQSSRRACSSTQQHSVTRLLLAILLLVRHGHAFLSSDLAIYASPRRRISTKSSLGYSGSSNDRPIRVYKSASHRYTPPAASIRNKQGPSRRHGGRDPVLIEQRMITALERIRSTEHPSLTEAPSFPSVRECNSALAAFGDSGNLLRALKLFGKMRKAALYGDRAIVPIPTLVTYSTLMSRAVKASKPLVALRLWDLMRNPTAKLNPILVDDIDLKAANIRMNCFAKLADVPRALDLLQQMKTGTGRDVPRIAPNIVTYNTLLHACQRAGDLDTALEVARGMHRCRPDARTYTSLIATVARKRSTSAGRNDPSLAFALLNEMKDAGIRPNGMTYSALIDACARCRRADLALKGLRIMLRQKKAEAATFDTRWSRDRVYTLSDEVGAWTAAINACGKGGRIRTALRLFRSMRTFGVMPNTVTCGSLVDSLLREGATTEALDVLRYMKTHGIRPSEVMYTSLMSRAESLAEMEQKFVSGEPLLNNQNHTSGSHEHGHGEVDAATDGARAVDVYTEMMKFLVERDGKASNKQLSRSSGAKNSEDVLIKVFLIFQEMKSAGATPDLACFNALLRACARAGDYKLAQDVLGQMLDAELCPNDTSWRMVLQAVAQLRDSRAVLAAWKQAVDHVCDWQRRSGRPTAALQWKPSPASFSVLVSSFFTHAAAVDDREQKRSMYRNVMRLLEKLRKGDPTLGLDRVDPHRFLENPRVMIWFVKAALALSELDSSSSGDAVKDATTNRQLLAALLKLQCFDMAQPRLSRSTQTVLDRAQRLLVETR